MAKIKFCGITGLDDAQRAVEAGAWALGMIFWPGSVRACDPGEAQRIGARLRRDVELTGVFVNPTLDEVAAYAETVPLSLVQLHGDEGPAFCAEVARRTGAQVIKAVAARTAADVRGLDQFPTAYHLMDAHAPDLRGGTGMTFEWSLVTTRASQAPLIVSGGLTPENVGEAIAATHPFAVDVATGTEAAPGRKDPEKLDAFAAAVRAASEVAA